MQSYEISNLRQLKIFNLLLDFCFWGFENQGKAAGLLRAVLMGPESGRLFTSRLYGILRSLGGIDSLADQLVSV